MFNDFDDLPDSGPRGPAYIQVAFAVKGDMSCCQQTMRSELKTRTAKCVRGKCMAAPDAGNSPSPMRFGHSTLRPLSRYFKNGLSFRTHQDRNGIGFSFKTNLELNGPFRWSMLFNGLRAHRDDRGDRLFDLFDRFNGFVDDSRRLPALREVFDQAWQVGRSRD